MKTYPLFKAHVDIPTAIGNLTHVLESGFINEGVQVTELTNALKEELVTENLVLVNSCTSALTMALRLAGVGPGDHVVSTPMTCVATNAPIVAAGADIVWADIDPESGMVTAKTILDAVTPQTRAVMVVAWAGTPPNLRSISSVCRHLGIPLILDAAHAFDAGFAGVPIHTFADYTCYSFQAIKHFTTGDGGALICTDRAQHQRSKAMKWFGLDRDRTKDAQGNWKGQQWDVDIVESGFKFNMNNLTAAIGLSQLPHVDKILAGHRSNAATYDDLFDGCKAVRPAKRQIEALSSHWAYTMLVNDEYSRLNRDALLATLNREGIMAGVVHVPNDDYTVFKRFQRNLPGVRAFSSAQFSLPCGWWLNEDDIRHIVSRVKVITA